jgi:hypothetical protein
LVGGITVKTNNPENYELVKACFSAFCGKRDMIPYTNAVYFEHGGFSCTARTEDEDRHFIAVDAGCPYCIDSKPDYCFNCGLNNQIDFEEV